MRFDLCVKFVLQKVSLLRETINRFALLPFREMFHLACFAKIRDAKQTKHFTKRQPFLYVSLFSDTEISYFAKTLVCQREVNCSFSV
jgi:hypothetical protein